MVRPFLIVFLLSILGVGRASAQPEDPAPPTDGRKKALESLYQAVKTKEQEVQRLREELSAAVEDVTKQSLSQQLEKRLDELDEIQSKFEETAVGVDASLFREKKEEPFSWEQTLGRVLEPILAEVEDATSASRKAANFKEEKKNFTEQQEVAERALRNLARIREATEDAKLQADLEVLIKRWEDRKVLAENQAKAAELRLKELEKQRTDITDYIRKFLSTRGLNLVFGIGAALGVFFVVRGFFSLLRIRKPKVQGLRTRLVSVLANILSVVGAIVTLLIVFSAAGDLFLVGIVLVFLIGAGWAGIKVLPEFVESLRLILNIGMVKEGERLLFDDVPWLVDSLAFTCRLTNPRLDGAVLKLPVKRLVGLHSRPFCEDEHEFPTKRGDWVALNDGAIGKIVVQNPASLVLEEVGGARRTYATPSFLDLAPRKLSSASFRIQTRFGIDYQHQAISTGQVPGWFHAALESNLPSVVGDHAVRSIEVQFASAGASSLDYEIEVDLEGSAAPLYEKVEFALQRILVDACNKHELVIPFQQLTIHQS